MTFLRYHHFLPSELEIPYCLFLHVMDKKISTRKFFGRFLDFDYKWFAMVVSHSAMKKAEKCQLTIQCIRFLEQQNARLKEVMMIADEYFFFFPS